MTKDEMIEAMRKEPQHAGLILLHALSINSSNVPWDEMDENTIPTIKTEDNIIKVEAFVDFIQERVMQTIVKELNAEEID